MGYRKKQCTKSCISSFWAVLGFLFCTISAQAQTSSYTFEKNLKDSINAFDGVFIYSEAKASLDSSIFVAGVNGLGLELTTLEGVELPNSISQAIVNNSSVEISFSTKYTFTGEPDDDGYTPVFTLKQSNSWHSAGLMIGVIRNFDENFPNTFNLIVLYAEGRGETNGAPPSKFNIVGPFNMGEWLPVNVIFDMEGRQVTVQAGDQFFQKKLAENFDVDYFKNAISLLNPFLGWESGMLEAFSLNPNGFGATITIDDLLIYTPKKPGSIEALKTSLDALKNHITKTELLDENALKEYANTIVTNYNGFYFDAKTEIDSYVQVYDKNFAPFFEHGELLDINNFAPESFIAFLLRQEVFDKGFVAEKMKEMAGISFPSHKFFPGPVSEEAPRLDNQEVEINSTYLLNPGYTLLDEQGGVRRPTGYYAAPGELITITVPEAMVNQKIRVYVGAHENDLANKIDRTNRFLRISKEVVIDSVTTLMVNPFGGGIYFRIPPGANLGWQTVTISGAVKAPYFRWIPGRETSESEWKQMVSDAHVPWIDLESDYVVFTVPLGLVNDKSPSEILPAWDNMWKAVQVASGRPLEKNRAEYLLIDRRGPTESISAGYPMTSGRNDAPNVDQNFHTNPFRILDQNWLQTSANGEYVHEMGHNQGFPTLRNEQETIVQLVGVPAYNLGLGAPIDSAFKYVENENHTRDLAAINWMIASNFRNNEAMNCDPTMPLGICDERRYQMRGGAKYVDIAMLFGWEGLGSVFKVFYDQWTERGTFNFGENFILEKELIQAASEGLQINVTPLLHFWGSIPGEDQVQELSSYPNSKLIYDRLQYYREIKQLFNHGINN